MKPLVHCLIFAALATGVAGALPPQSVPVLTSIADVVYRADGTPASGTLLITWPAFETAEAVSNKDIVDEGKFREGLGKIIDGVVQCLNASAWAKAK